MTSSTLPPLFADEDGSKESNDLVSTGLTHPEAPYSIFKVHSPCSTSEPPSFVKLNNILLCVYTTFYLLILLSVETWAVLAFWIL